MKASLMAANFWFSCTAIAPPLSSASLRSSNGLSVTNTMPAFELLVKPLIDRPGKRDRALDARLLERDVAHAADDVLGAVERGAVGQLREADQILLVLARHEAAGHRLEQAERHADQHEIDAHHHRLARR